MNKIIIKQGDLLNEDFARILLYCHKEKINGVVKVKNIIYEKNIYIDNGTVYFATSTNHRDSLGEILLQERVISPEEFESSTKYMQEKGIRHGRALLELGIISHEQLWEYVEKQLKQIIFALFSERSGNYTISPLFQKIEENITLNYEVPYLILEGCRKLLDKNFIESFFKSKKKFFFQKKDPDVEKRLKPYEFHILELIKKFNDLEIILRKSELLPFETKKIIYFLFVSEIITTDSSIKTDSAQEVPLQKSRSRFSSFAEAIKYYNSVYRHIFKILHKELGLVSINLLNQSINAISEKLPLYLQNQQLKSDGMIEEESILKNLWYSDNQNSWQEFLNGMEEILYAEIYTVRKNLGKDYEQEILKWIREREKS